MERGQGWGENSHMWAKACVGGSPCQCQSRGMQALLSACPDLGQDGKRVGWGLKAARNGVKLFISVAL